MVWKYTYTYNNTKLLTKQEGLSLTFEFELLVDHNGFNSKSDLSSIIPRGKPFKLVEGDTDS